ncbi:MAG: serine hydroxymethyltransferase [Pseudomonadota bacterium]
MDLINVRSLVSQQQNYAQQTLSLIASENYTCSETQNIVGSVLTNKYAEGKVGKRYYTGCRYIDEIEYAAEKNACKLFDVKFANTQPYSGSIANLAVYVALLEPGDTILSMSLSSGGHISHGLKVNISGKLYNIVHYYVNKETFLLDYDQIEEIAIQCKPKLIIAGISSYSHDLDFKRFSNIAKRVGAYLMADIAHIAGIIAAGKHMNPNIYADIITTTTHKTLRGPRGGMIMTNDVVIARKVDKALFPGLQGGPLMNVIAAKALCFENALKDSFKLYIDQVLLNTKNLIIELKKLGCNVLTGSSNNHMFLIDTMKNFNLTGVEAQNLLESVGVLCNKNVLPFDTLAPHIASGIRIGLAAATSRNINDMQSLAKIITTVLHHKGDKDLSMKRLLEHLLIDSNVQCFK